MNAPIIKRPVLTLPAAEAAWVTQAYQDAKVILEYGSGGSTVLAAEMPGKTIFSVESDRAWTDMLAAYLTSADVLSMPTLHYCDVGPTGRWGRPKNDSGWRNYHAYPLSVWERPDFVQPDVVLIDGRFRAACFLTVLFRATQPVTVYFDDYIGRAKYHIAEQFVPRAEVRGRMARFDVTPQPIPADRLSAIIAAFGVPF